MHEVAQATAPMDTTTSIDGGGGGGGAGMVDTTTGGVDTGLTDFEQNLVDQGGGVQAEPGAPISAPGEGMLTQEAIDELEKIIAELQTKDAIIENEMRTIMSDHGGFADVLKQINAAGLLPSGEKRSYGNYD